METNQSFSVVLLFFFLHFVSSCSSLSTKNIVTDGEALLALKAHITHDPNNLLANNWSTSSSVCNWIGVTCGVRHCRVTRLDISSFGLVGTIPPQLGNLSFLAFLNISNNSFYGSLPDEFAHLRRLLYVNFIHNHLSGTVPSSIFNISSLQRLGLGDNQLSSFANISGGGPINLTTLDLSENMFEGEIPSFILKFKQLQILSLANNNLKGGIPKEIGNLTKLKELYIDDNKLQGTIPSNLWKCRELTGAFLENNRLSGRIPREIGNLTSLKYLRLSLNNLTGGIPNEIGSIPNLEAPDLGFNNLDGHVPATIFNISTLQWLSLEINKLSGSLPSSIGFGIPNIEVFNVAVNYFSGTFPNFITNATRLNFLDIRNNSFSGFIPSTIGKGLTNLQMIILDDNNFTSNLQMSFLTSLTNCKNLRLASFAGNPLNGFLPTSIGNLSNSLEQIYLPSCNISGNIPQEIGNLKNLMVLSLDANELTGSISATLGNLKQLQGLDLRLNKLEGSIPNDLCHLDKLVDLYLQNNKLSGAIPPCFDKMTGLRIVSLSSNGLSSIPPSFWKLKDILQIDLSSNFIIGTVPLAFGNLTVVIDVDLSRNYLTGEIPTTIGGLQNLQNLSLGYNILQGSIPESFRGLISLEFLDLSNNNLSGVIPKSLEALSYLKYLNLSSNQLEGKIPTEGPFSNFSAKSFLMNHALCGLPRLKVPPCKTNTHPKSKITVVLAITLPLTLIVSVTLIIMMREYRKRRSSQLANDNDIDVLQRAIWRRISYQELVRSTEGFNESNLLGRGGFGSVFRGKLLDGMEIAVKVFHVQMERALRSFDVECEVLSGIRHRNLVKIISSCTNEDMKALVLEYMPNGSLAKYLYSNEFFLDILQRLNILIDVASGLEYLHFGYSIPIVHCDIKPSNVLLDQDMVGHLSDFGIAKLLGEDESMTQTQTLATVGYMAPEYEREGRVSRECDVYSYGIVLMETFTKKKPADEIFTEEMSLRHWVSDSFNRSIMEVVDNDLLRMEDAYFLILEQCVSSILSLAMGCTTYLPEDRINIRNVVNRLVQIRATFSLSTRGRHLRVR
ncbi:hypothetical protein ACOSQ4_003826 [Xanthoceras sorbifolium]